MRLCRFSHDRLGLVRGDEVFDVTAALAKEAHEKICPYSHATRNNVDVQIEVAGK